MSRRVDLPTACARARGLAVHLMPRRDLEALAELRDLPSLARALGAADRLAEPVAAPATPAAIEAAVRRAAARHLQRLGAWTGAAAALDLFHADQDRRSVRAMLRGALEGAPAEARLAGLLPTPRLPERALAELARQPSPAKVALHLVVLRHPYGDPLVTPSAAAHPVLLALEVALLRASANRLRAAARAGDRNLRAYGRARVDAANLEMALALAGSGAELDPAACFVEGGAALARAAYVAACRAATRAEAAARLARALAGSPLARVAAASAGDPARVDRDALAQAIAEQRRRARLDPLGSAPLLSFLLRLEAQSRDLRRIAWAASLGAPGAAVDPELVTPWS